jgi:alpha-glucoside transport system permease protein
VTKPPEVRGNLAWLPRLRLADRLLVLDDLGPHGRDRVRPQVWQAYLFLVPLVVILGLLVVWPSLRTVWQALTAGCHGGVCGHNFAAAWSGWRVLLRTLAWAVALPVAMIAVGFGLAVALRRIRHSGLVTALLVTPMAVPMVATGLAFRLLYDPEPDRGAATAVASWVAGRFGGGTPEALGSGTITFALMSAFCWAYLGLSVAVFRRVLAAIPVEQVSMVLAEGGRRRDVYRWFYWPVLFRVAALLLAVTGLASARSFDLLLVMAPGSSQPAGEVVALHVWRYGPGTGAEVGPAAALSVLWFAILVCTVIAPLFAFRARWRMPPVDEGSDVARELLARRERRGGTVRHAVAWVVGLAAAVLWLIPALVLAFTSLHSDAGFAVRGLRSPLSGAAWAGLLDSGYLPTAVGTLLLAVGVAVVVVAFSGLAAYALGWLRPPGHGVIMVVVMICATVPVQAITDPLVSMLAHAGLPGSWPALLLVHVAFGIPITTVLLYGTFGTLSPEQLRAAAAGDPQVSGGPVRAVFARIWPNLFAAGALEFVQVWNDLVIGLLFAPAQLQPAGPALLGTLRYFTTNTAGVSAATLVYALVPLAVVLLLHRQIVRLLLGGLTGTWKAEET